MNIEWLLFEEEGIEVGRGFGREMCWMEERWREWREWENGRGEEWGRIWVEGRRIGVGKRGEEREGTLRVDRERARRNREKKRKEKEAMDKCRGDTPIARVSALGARTIGRRNVVGVINDGGNRRRETKVKE